MMNPEDLTNRRTRTQESGSTNQDTKQVSENKIETRQLQNNSSTPEILTNPIYTPAFLRTQIGKLMRIEFLIGTNNLVDRIGFLEDVGASYILLRSFEGDSMIYADIYAIKFITISATYTGAPSYQNFNNMNTQGMNNAMNMNSIMNRYY